MAGKHFYITTTLPYVNAEPHVGFAMELIRADVIARYKKLSGYNVFFNTGTDEHGQKLFEAAKKTGEGAQSYVDRLSEKYRALLSLLGILPEVRFIRTTDHNHKKSAVLFWQKCLEAGFIYKKHYRVKYCVGCELEKTDSELVDGRCPLHPNLEIEVREEENYFFKFSEFQKPLLNFYSKRPNFVIPESRFREIQNFVAGGLEDFSISRLTSKMSWGVPVPNDPEHVMYVWFDALVNYISTLGWPEGKDFSTYWQEGGEIIQYCGKDNLRQQAAMWQAMLMAANLPNSTSIVINGFITGGNGQKMSKSLGNVISPFNVVAGYGTDALRYFVTRELANFEDADFTLERFREAYNANLANGLGNLVSRIIKMATVNGVELSLEEKTATYYGPGHTSLFLDHFELAKEMDDIWGAIKLLDKSIQDNEPFKKIKTDPVGAKEEINDLLRGLFRVALRLEPFLPQTSVKIQTAIKENKMPEPLFPRKE
jgi:methionyl-tRNA synthetase